MERFMTLACQMAEGEVTGHFDCGTRVVRVIHGRDAQTDPLLTGKCLYTRVAIFAVSVLEMKLDSRYVARIESAYPDEKSFLGSSVTMCES
jgi:hypothetical protein